MRSATRELTSDGRAVRALARSGLSVVRVPQDLPILVRHGLPDPETVGLPSLLRLGLIAPVARGLYEVRTPAGVSRGSFGDLLAGRFADTPHLVTGWWALADANLTNQDVRRVIVLTATNRRTTTIAGHVVQPVPTTDELWGAIRRRNGLVVARPERALCDCAGNTRPARIPATRIAEALAAYLDATPRAIDRLTRAARRTGSPVVARRLGYLVELLAGEEVAQPLLDLFPVPHRADALDPGDENAPITPRWHLRTRLTPEELLEHRVVS